MPAGSNRDDDQRGGCIVRQKKCEKGASDQLVHPEQDGVIRGCGDMGTWGDDGKAKAQRDHVPYGLQIENGLSSESISSLDNFFPSQIFSGPQ